MSRAKPFDDSSRAAAANGPSALIPVSSRRSARPAESGASGPITTKSTRCERANSTSRSKSIAPMGTHSATSAMPGLPGAQTSRETSGLAEIAQASACSRPPEPTTRMFKNAFPAGLPCNGLYHAHMTGETVLDFSEPAPAPNLREYSVSELSNLLKRTVENGFAWVRVRGEISKVARNSSGHCYFDLKDDRAVIASVIWKGTWP